MGNASLPPLSIHNSAPISTAVAPPISTHTLLCRSDGIICDVPTCISIVSNSYLLQEALLLLLRNHWSVDVNPDALGEIQCDSNVANLNQSLILLDSNIGHSAVLAQIQDWRSLPTSPYIIVVELKNDPDLILDCIEAGAHGYALQGASGVDVIQVIEQVQQGGAQCSPEITAKLFDRLTQSKVEVCSPEKPKLTRRELEVLQCVAKDYSDRDIATQLVIEVRTVKHHIHNILRKLNVKYRRDAAQLALDNHWLD